jgi:hypothetical protein
MEVIIVSVQFRITIREFPVRLVDVFIAVKGVLTDVGRALTQEILKRIEEKRAVTLQANGYIRCGYQSRVFQSSLGRVCLRLLKLRSPEGKIRYGLAEQVEIPAYSRITEDSFEPSLGLLPHVSYRRSSLEVSRISGSSPGKSSLHRRLKDLAPEVEIHPEQQAKGYRYLVVDGTGAKFQVPHFVKGRRKVETYRGDLKAVYASKGVGEPFEIIGRWTNTSWRDISKVVYQRIQSSDIRILISDGEGGIEEAFLLPHMRHQRCSVHAWKQLRMFLFKDGVKKNQQTMFHAAMKNVPVFAYNQKKMESLKDRDAKEVKRAVEVSERQLLDLRDLLEKKGYHSTASYVAGLSSTLLTFLNEWLQTSQCCPATSNIAENRFSLVKNRIARVGRRWSEPGLKRWLDLAIHKTFPGYDWNKLWEKLLPVTSNISCEIVGVY